MKDINFQLDKICRDTLRSFNGYYKFFLVRSEVFAAEPEKFISLLSESYKSEDLSTLVKYEKELEDTDNYNIDVEILNLTVDEFITLSDKKKTICSPGHVNFTFDKPSSKDGGVIVVSDFEDFEKINNEMDYQKQSGFVYQTLRFWNIIFLTSDVIEEHEPTCFALIRQKDLGRKNSINLDDGYTLELEYDIHYSNVFSLPLDLIVFEERRSKTKYPERFANYAKYIQDKYKIELGQDGIDKAICNILENEKSDYRHWILDAEAIWKSSLRNSLLSSLIKCLQKLESTWNNNDYYDITYCKMLAAIIDGFLDNYTFEQDAIILSLKGKAENYIINSKKSILQPLEDTDAGEDFCRDDEEWNWENQNPVKDEETK